MLTTIIIVAFLAICAVGVVVIACMNSSAISQEEERLSTELLEEDSEDGKQEY